MDPIAHINPPTDTTLAMMLAGQALGAALFYMEQDDLSLRDGKIFANARPVEVFDDNSRWFRLGAAETVSVTAFDVMLMRKDPPVDKRFIHSCYMLEQAAAEGVRVISNPAALRDYNEKLFAARFPQFSPAYTVTSDANLLRAFHKTHKKIVIKPLDAMGGQGVFLVEENGLNLDVIWELHTQKGKYPVMAQAYLPAIAEGDKRVVVLDGKPADHVLVRKPREGSIRSNLAAGGSYIVREINDAERHIAETVGVKLKALDIPFAGLDVIGDRLTEINITSPTGLRQLSAGCGIDLSLRLMTRILSPL